MRNSYLFIIMALINLNNLFANLRPLDFDTRFPVNNVDRMLIISTKLFHDVKSLDLSLKTSLDRVINQLVELIGAIYKYHDKNRKYQIQPEVLDYLLNLISDANFEFDSFQQESNFSQNQFISNLFFQVKQLLITKSNLYQLCH